MEYRQYIEKDTALERRFQPLDVKEPTVDETMEILKTILPRYLLNIQNTMKWNTQINLS